MILCRNYIQIKYRVQKSDICSFKKLKRTPEQTVDCLNLLVQMMVVPA
jgi:hypothetical protein